MNNNNINTLDTKHSQKCQHFKNTRALAGNNVAELNATENKIKFYVTNGLSQLDEKEFQKYLVLLDKKKHLEKVIKQAEVDELEYMINTADIVFSYYDVIENGTDANRNEKEIGVSGIMKYFMQDKQCGLEDQNTSFGDDPTNDPANDRATLLDKYLEKTETNYYKTLSKEDTCCSICGSLNMTVSTNDGLGVCNDCHAVEAVLVDHEKTSYKDPPKEITYFAYKRIEWIVRKSVALVAMLVDLHLIKSATLSNCGKPSVMHQDTKVVKVLVA
jgi:hypothetical protein